MPDVNIVIDNLDTIATAQYQSTDPSRPAPSRKTMHHIGFDNLQGAAARVRDTLRSNPVLTADMKENITASFAAIKDGVDGYCPKVATASTILVAYNRASSEWAKIAG